MGLTPAGSIRIKKENNLGIKPTYEIWKLMIL